MERENVMNCFTEVEEGVNAEFNKVTTKCISSTNNAFSMDCEGNLVVNSIMTREGTIGGLDIDMVYPIGSIYLSVNSTNPSELFGGTWEQIKGYYLYAGETLGTGGSNETSSNGAGATGSTILTANQIPSHRHTIPALSGTAASNGGHSHQLGMVSGSVSSGSNFARPKDVSEVTKRGYTSTTAGAHTHNVTTVANNTGYVGSGTGHTHTLPNHTHTVTPTFYSMYVWKRVA